jgi:hypothetical protein
MQAQHFFPQTVNNIVINNFAPQANEFHPQVNFGWETNSDEDYSSETGQT